MSFAPLSDFLCRQSFLGVSAGHLGLYHGDTETSHPYVCATLAETQDTVPQIEVKPAPAPSFQAVPARHHAAPPVSWHAQYCLNRFGRTTPPSP